MGKPSKARQAKRAAVALVKNSSRAELLRVLGTRVDRLSRPVPTMTFTALEIAEDAGVSVDVVRDLMRECAVPDQVRMDRQRGEVVATFAGWGKIQLMLDERMASSTTPKPPVVATPKGVTLTITRLHGAKRVLADRDDTGREVVCCVQTTEKLAPGLKLEGARESEGLWYYIGRMPRRKGRW